MQDKVLELANLGPMPSADQASDEQVEAYEQAVAGLQQPLTDVELHVLVACFPHDADEDFYGIAWSLLHAIEASPEWMQTVESLQLVDGWQERLKLRLERSKSSSP